MKADKKPLKQLFTERQLDVLSIGAKLLYGMMIDRMELSLKNGWIDGNERTYIYFMVDEVKDKFHCANDKAVKLMRELDSDKGIGLIQYDLISLIIISIVTFRFSKFKKFLHRIINSCKTWLMKNWSNFN